jgi:hypothetical protein
MNTSSDTDYYSSPRRDSTAHRSASEYPRRGRPVDQPGEPVQYPNRGKPIAAPLAPRRQIRRDDADDDPPMRPARLPDRGDPPARRGQSVEQRVEGTETEAPRRGGPSPASAATPRPSGQADEADAPPLPRTGTPASEPGPRPTRASAPVGPAKQAEPAEGGPAGTTFTTGGDAAEIEDILKLLESRITELNLSARDLHTLASLTAMLGLRVSSLAKQKDEAGKSTGLHPHADDPPEPED